VTGQEMVELQEWESGGGFGSPLVDMQLRRVMEDAGVGDGERLGKDLEEEIRALKQAMDEMGMELEFSGAKSLNFQSDKCEVWKQACKAAPVPIRRGNVVAIAGSYLLKTMTRQRINVDIAVSMSPDMFLEKDYKQYRYFDRRLAFLQAIKVGLKKRSEGRWKGFSIGNSKYHVAGDALRPVLALRLTKCPGVVIKILPILELLCFHPNRVKGDRNNCGSSDARENCRYNAAIVSDALVIEDMRTTFEIAKHISAFLPANLLLRSWAQRRGILDIAGRRGLISGFVVTALLVKVAERKLIPPHASLNHVLRVVFSFIINGGLRGPGSSKDPYLNIHEEHFTSGVNVLSWITAGGLEEIEYQAHLTLLSLNATGLSREPLEGLCPAFFLPSSSIPFSCRFDCICSVESDSVIDSISRDMIVQTCERALRNRCRSAVAFHEPNSRELLICLRLDPSEVNRKVDTCGPHEDESEFVGFWEGKASRRRFKSGQICQSVVWNDNGDSVISQIVKFILPLKLSGVQDIKVRFDNIDKILPSPSLSNSMTTPAVFGICERLATILKKLEGIPLSFSSVSFVSPHLRYASVTTNGDQTSSCVEPIEALAYFESSNKWPKDGPALDAAKVGFFLAMKESLRAQGIPSEVTRAFLDVELESLVFRVYLIPGQASTASLSESTEKHFVDIPTQDLVGFHECVRRIGLRRESGVSIFSSTLRLAKRWIAAHLFSDQIDEIVVELLASRPFAHCFPARDGDSTPASALAGFAHFLRTLSEFPFEAAPFCIPDDDEGRMQEFFERSWAYYDSLPKTPHRAMVILAHAQDNQDLTHFRGRVPELVVLRRMAATAKAALSTIEQSLFSGDEEADTLFRPPTDVYDGCFQLRRENVPRLPYGIDENAKRARKVLKTGPFVRGKNTSLDNLWIGFDPIENLVGCLRHELDPYALFFYDKYGGDKVHFLWKPLGRQSRPFSLSSIAFSKPALHEQDQEEDAIQCNTDELLHRMFQLGHGLVQSCLLPPSC